MQNSNRKTEYNETQTPVHIAVDVSKETLEILHPQQGMARIDNNAGSIRGWLRRLQKRPGTRMIVCEASGGYEKTLMACCWELENKLPVALLIRE